MSNTEDHRFCALRADMERHWTELHDLRLAVEKRLHDAGIAQWTDTARGLDQLAQFVNRDEMFIVLSSGALAGAFALTRRWDSFWRDDPERERFLYLHKVMTHPDFAGTGVGRWIAAWARQEAVRRRLSGVRLDCWVGNKELRRVWERLGFTWLRDVPVPGRSSGTLMEMKL